MRKSIDITAFRKGEDHAWKAVFDAFFRPIIMFIAGKNDDWSGAEELAQHCFVKLFDIREGIESPAHLRNVLYLLASREFINHQSATKRRKTREKNFQEGFEEVAYQTVEAALQEHRILLRAFDTVKLLTPPEKEALLEWLSQPNWRNEPHSNQYYIALCRGRKRLRQLMGPAIKNEQI